MQKIKGDKMKTAIKRLFNNTRTVFKFLYSLTRGIDLQTINGYILKISQSQDIDSITYKTYQCLNDIFDCEFFAFALYDRKYNGGVDIWMEPKLNDTAVAEHIKKDFMSESTDCNIRSFENPLDGSLQPKNEVKTSKIIIIPILDKQSKKNNRKSWSKIK